MNRRRSSSKTHAATAGLLAGLLLVAHSAAARPRPSEALHDDVAIGAELAPAQREQLFPVQRGGGVSLAQATAMAQGRFQGRVVRAETVRVGERLVHEIRILGEDGRTVRTVRIDAQTGAFL